MRCWISELLRTCCHLCGHRWCFCFGLYSADSQTCLFPSPLLRPSLASLSNYSESFWKGCRPARFPAGTIHSWIPGRRVLSDRWLLWCMPGMPNHLCTQMHTHHHQQHVQTTRLDFFWSSTCAGPPLPPDPLMSTSTGTSASTALPPEVTRRQYQTWALVPLGWPSKKHSLWEIQKWLGLLSIQSFFFFFKNEHLYFF